MNKEIINSANCFVENGLSWIKEFVFKEPVLSSRPLTVTPRGLHSEYFGLMRQYSVDHMRHSRPQDFDPLEAAVLINAEQSVLEAPGRQAVYVMTCAPHQDVRFIATMTRPTEEPNLVYLKSYRLAKDVKSKEADSLLGLLAEEVDGRERKEVTAEDGQKASILVIKEEKSFISDLGEIREAELGRPEPRVLEFFEPRLEFWPRLEFRLGLMRRLIEDIKPEILRPLFSREPQKEEALQSVAQSMVIEPPAKAVPEQRQAKLEKRLELEEKSPPLAVMTIARFTTTLTARPTFRLAIRPMIQPSLECQIQPTIQPVLLKEKIQVLELQPQPELAVVKQRQQFPTERQTLQLWLSAEQAKAKAKAKVLEKAVARSAIRPTAKPTRVEPLPIIIEGARKKRKPVIAAPLISVKSLTAEAEQLQKSMVIKPEESLRIILEAPIVKLNQEPEELVIVESVPVVFGWQSHLFRIRARKERRLLDFKTKEVLTPISFKQDWVWPVKGFEKREDMSLTNLLLHSLTSPVKALIQAADPSTSLPANQVIFDRQWLETEMIIPIRNTKIIQADEYPEELTVEAGFLELVERLLADEREDDYQGLLPFYLYLNEEN